jgi:hypothetical protein
MTARLTVGRHDQSVTPGMELELVPAVQDDFPVLEQAPQFFRRYDFFTHLKFLAFAHRLSPFHRLSGKAKG